MATRPNVSIASAVHAAQAPDKKAFAIFAVVSLAFLMTSIQATIFVVAFPAMLQELHTNLAWLGWTLTGYQLAQTIAMPLAGKLGDEMGRGRLFVASIILFTVASVGAGFAPDVYTLIGFRVMQAIGAGAMTPLGTGMVSDAFGEKRNTYIGLFTSVWPFGAVIGPVLGGVVIDHLSWPWVFFIMGPIGAVLTVVGLMALPAGVASARRHRVDYTGLGLFALAMTALLFALTAWADSPDALHHPLVWTFAALGAGAGAAFLWYEGRVDSPMVELKLLRWRPFLGANLYNFMHGAAVQGFFSFIPLYATTVYAMSASQSGAVITPRAIVMMLVAVPSSLFLIRLGYRLPMILGVLLMALTLVLLGLAPHDVGLFGAHIPNVVLVMSIIVLSGIGLGLSSPASSSAALDLMPEKVAALAGLRGMFRSTGGVVSTALVVLILSHYQDKGLGLQHIFLGLSVVLLAVIPVVFMIPDSARDRRVAARSNGARQAGV